MLLIGRAIERVHNDSAGGFLIGRDGRQLVRRPGGVVILKDADRVGEREIARIGSRARVESDMITSRRESRLDVSGHGLHVRVVAAGVVGGCFIEEDTVDVDIFSTGILRPAGVRVDFALDI